jgi:hypothetical protein
MGVPKRLSTMRKWCADAELLTACESTSTSVVCGSRPQEAKRVRADGLHGRPRCRARPKVKAVVRSVAAGVFSGDGSDVIGESFHDRGAVATGLSLRPRRNPAGDLRWTRGMAEDRSRGGCLERWDNDAKTGQNRFRGCQGGWQSDVCILPNRDARAKTIPRFSIFIENLQEQRDSDTSPLTRKEEQYETGNDGRCEIR